MAATSPSVDEVHAAIVERLQQGAYPIGSRMPSCRKLAEDLGSNPSTVDRAVRRMAEQGLVRTVARQGTFVATTRSLRLVSGHELTGELDQLVHRAWRAGIWVTEFQRLVEDGYRRVVRRPRIAFIECNPRDLATLSERVQAVSGLEIEPLMLDEIDPASLATDYDVVVTPFFHRNDLVSRAVELERLVAVNVSVSPPVLRRIATLDPQGSVAVAAPTASGLQQIGNIVRQYFGGRIRKFRIGRSGLAELAGVSAVVVSNAAELPAVDGALGCQVIPIQWEIEDGFGAYLLAQVDRLGQRV